MCKKRKKIISYHSKTDVVIYVCDCYGFQWIRTIYIHHFKHFTIGWIFILQSEISNLNFQWEFVLLQSRTEPLACCCVKQLLRCTDSCHYNTRNITLVLSSQQRVESDKVDRRWQEALATYDRMQSDGLRNKASVVSHGFTHASVTPLLPNNNRNGNKISPYPFTFKQMFSNISRTYAAVWTLQPC